MPLWHAAFRIEGKNLGYIIVNFAQKLVENLCILECCVAPLAGCPPRAVRRVPENHDVASRTVVRRQLVDSVLDTDVPHESFHSQKQGKVCTGKLTRDPAE